MPRIVSDVQLETGRRRTSRNGAIVFAITLFVLGAALVCAVSQFAFGGITVWTLVVAVLVGWLLTMSFHVVMEWEKAVVMRLGRFNRVAGPGIVLTWPIIEFCTIRIDQRVIVTYFGAEETLTNDLVTVNVDAVVYWMVFSAEKAAIEVEDYAAVVNWAAQTALRKAIGRASLREVATRRDQLDKELKAELEEKLEPWGIDIMDVEIRDIVLSRELQGIMAGKAVAEREKEARVTLAEVEPDIAEMLADAGGIYEDNEAALKLRTMQMTYESVKQSKGTVVVPNSVSDGFVDAPKEQGA